LKMSEVIKKFEIKKKFRDSDFYKNVKIFVNERDKNPERRKRSLDEIKKDFYFEYKTKEFGLKEEQVELDKDEDITRLETKKKDKKTISKKLKEFEKHIILKAINTKAKKDRSLFRFDLLKEELEIGGVEDIIKDRFLGDIRINIITAKDKDFSDIDNKEKLNLLLKSFEKISDSLKEISNPYKGTEFKHTEFVKYFGEPKEKSVKIDEESKHLEEELKNYNWYVLDAFIGTDQEIKLVNFLKERIGNLKKEYETIYLLRNEEVYKVYDFKKGRGFEPDFLLFLKEKERRLYYQVFIEPKGGQFKDREGGFKESKEGWKEEFLDEISERYGDNKILKFENKDYKLIGLPLFNEKDKKVFEERFNGQLLNHGI